MSDFRNIINSDHFKELRAIGRAETTNRDQYLRFRALWKIVYPQFTSGIRADRVELKTIQRSGNIRQSSQLMADFSEFRKAASIINKWMIELKQRAKAANDAQRAMKPAEQA